MYYEDMIFTKEDIDLLVFENSEFLNCTFRGAKFSLPDLVGLVRDFDIKIV